MGGLVDALGGPVKGLIEGIGGVIDKLHTSEEEKAQAKLALFQAEAELTKELARVDAEWAKAQAQVITAEQNGSWLASSWRPILMLTFTYIIAHTYVLAPMFSLPPVEIPEPMWELLKLGVGGYVVGRTAEKIVREYKK